MSMSSDISNLEIVNNYAKFIDLLLNPEKLKESLDNIQTLVGVYQERLGLIKTKEEADSYLSKARVIFDESKQFLALEKEKQDTQFQVAMTRLKEEKESLDRLTTAINKREEASIIRENAASVCLEQAESKLSEANRLNILAVKQKEALDDLETKLNEKQDKLIKLLG